MSGETDNVVGTVELTHSTRLVFSVQPWKGRMLAHVRKFVSTPKYEGPTKAGLAMGGDVLVSVIEALTRLKEEVPGPEERRFAQLPKRGDTDIVVTVIPPDNRKALPSVDVREYVNKASYTGPTKKGVRFSWRSCRSSSGFWKSKLGSWAKRPSHSRSSFRRATPHR